MDRSDCFSTERCYLLFFGFQYSRTFQNFVLVSTARIHLTVLDDICKFISCAFGLGVCQISESKTSLLEAACARQSNREARVGRKHPHAFQQQITVRTQPTSPSRDILACDRLANITKRKIRYWTRFVFSRLRHMYCCLCVLLAQCRDPPCCYCRDDTHFLFVPKLVKHQVQKHTTYTIWEDKSQLAQLCTQTEQIEQIAKLTYFGIVRVFNLS